MTETPRDDQIHRAAITIGELGSRLHTNPHALVELCDTISGLIGSADRGGPRPKGSISDPTSAQALTEDRVRADLRAVHKAIDNATTALVILSTHWTAYMPSKKQITERARAHESLDELEGCRTHKAAGLFMLAGDRYKGLCRRCGDFRAAHHCDPSPELIRALETGRRLTDRLIAQTCPEALKSA